MCRSSFRNGLGCASRTFIDASPAQALKTARQAAGGQDVRIGRGPTTIRDFLAAGLVEIWTPRVVPGVANTVTDQPILAVAALATTLPPCCLCPREDSNLRHTV